MARKKKEISDSEGISNIKKLSKVSTYTVSNIVSNITDIVKIEKTEEEKNLARRNLASSLAYPSEEYQDLVFTEEEVNRLRQRFTYLSSGATASSTLICAGELCKFKNNCLFWTMGKAPVNRPCLLESNLLSEWRRKYIEEYKIDPDSFTELTIVNELAEIETMLWRVNQSLALHANSEFVQDNIKAVDREGSVYSEKAVSAYFEVKERLSNRKAKLIKLMVGDRQEKYKMAAAMKQKDASDPSVALATAKRELKQLIDKAKSKQIPSIDTDSVTPDDIIKDEGSEE